jgi:hypothetical protein
MPNDRRGLRSATVKPPCQETEPDTVRSNNITGPSTDLLTTSIILPGRNLPGLDPDGLQLLRQKQARLRSNARTTLQSLPPNLRHLRRALEATLIFAQYEAGTAVCIEPAWILTCAHCFGDTYEEYLAANKRKWLLFYHGLAVLAECRFWDGRRDLALLNIVAVEAEHDGEIPPQSFVSLAVSETIPLSTERLLCIGQPGSDDLESTAARKTRYNLVELSEGKYCGMMKGADPQNNREIGTFKHDCASAPFVLVDISNMVPTQDSAWTVAAFRADSLC